MKKIFLSLCTLVLVTLTSFGQTTHYTITGLVYDTNNQALEGVTVSLLHAKDSSRAGHSVSDKTSQYKFDHPTPGSYILLFTSVGYTKAYSEPLILKDSSSGKTVPAIQLHTATNTLAGVTVAARKSFIEQKIDRTVVNVDAAVTNNGATALEVLEKLPGVSVDKDGNVSMKGKAGVKMNETALKANLPIGIDIYSAKTDYAQILRKSVKLETGLKSSYVTTTNRADYYYLQGTEWKPDYEKTNNFRYSERINAAYINPNKQFKKLGVQTGLRYENTYYKGRQATRKNKIPLLSAATTASSQPCSSAIPPTRKTRLAST